MAAFRAGEIDVLVCTTVIEVGVDVPNATVMVVIDADRFGISQLHQLRGRIGRGQHPSLCLLATKLPEGSKAGERLKAVAGTLDGFVLADLDLKERKEGDVLGLSQSGRPITLRFLSLSEHLDIILAARQFCESQYEDEPQQSRNGGPGCPVHRYRPRRIPGQVMSRNRLLWLAISVVVSVLVAYQVVASSGQRAQFVAQSRHPHRRTGYRRACRCDDRAPPHPGFRLSAGRRSATAGPTTTPRRAATTDVIPATTSLIGISSTRLMCRSSGAPTPWQLACCMTRTQARQ